MNGYDASGDIEKRRKSLRNADVNKRKDDIFQELFQGNKREGKLNGAATFLK